MTMTQKDLRILGLTPCTKTPQKPELVGHQGADLMACPITITYSKLPHESEAPVCRLASLPAHSHFTLTHRHTLWPRGCSSFDQEALPLLLPALATPWLAGSVMRNWSCCPCIVGVGVVIKNFAGSLISQGRPFLFEMCALCLCGCVHERGCLFLWPCR